MNEADLIAIDRELGSRSLSDFIKIAWPQIDAEVYEHNWHMDVISDHLMACHAGEINRVCFNVPPGTSKSSAASVFWPAWLWGPGGAPHTRYLGASHESGLAERDNMRSKTLIKSDWFQARWPTKLTVERSDDVQNDAGGFRQATSVTSMTGKRGHYVTWDDPHTAEGADSDTQRATAVRIMRETLTTRLVDPRSSTIIVIMQRLHAKDVTGEILEREMGYTHVMLPMEFEPKRRCYTVVKPSWMTSKPVQARYDTERQIWHIEGAPIDERDAERIAKKPVQTVYNQDPRTEQDELLFPKRFTREVVDRDKRAMGSYATAGQFQQSPVARQGGIFDVSKIRILAAAPPFQRVARGWDLAASENKQAAFTAGVGIGETALGHIVIFNVKRGQWSDADVVANIPATASQDTAAYPSIVGSIPQDPGAGGKAWSASIVRACAGHVYHMSPETGSKETRARALGAQTEIGNVYLVKGDWNQAFLDEMQAFPNGKFKDQVDAASRAFTVLMSLPVSTFYVGS